MYCRQRSTLRRLHFGPKDGEHLKHVREARAARENIEMFNERFSRYRGLLHFMAGRVLGRSERADLALGNSWLAASLNPPRLDNEGAFRSWLFRILIDEALAILRRTREPVGRGPSR